MKHLAIGVFAAALVAVVFGATTTTKDDNPSAARSVEKAARWLASVQGNDGGWGQDGGEKSFVRQGERLESSGNDVANTAVATMALIAAGSTPIKGEYREQVRRGIDFVLQHVEDSPDQGLALSTVTGTQIQRKLGPYIDTFLSSMLLSEVDGTMGDKKSEARVRASLQKCVAKIEKNQLKDGSWNVAGGWAPILGTSMASRSLFVAQQKGVAVDGATMARVETYTATSVAEVAAAPVGVSAGAAGGVLASGSSLPLYGRSMPTSVSMASAGVPLYQRAQALEQMTRTPGDRKKNERDIKQMAKEISDPRVIAGFGSMGGEEFFSYLNVSDSLHRTGGPEWAAWNDRIKTQLVKLQNEDGTWAGHHCITGRVAVTSAAVLTILADGKPVK
jgi:hypothetical protein